MKCIHSYLKMVCAIFTIMTLSVAFAGPPVPITASQAFDAVQMQVDPDTGAPASVILIDVRDPIEYVSNGAAAAVSEIRFVGENHLTVNPDFGKVFLTEGGQFIEYSVNGRYQKMRTANIDGMSMTPIAYNIPFWRRTATGWDKSTESDFYDAINNFPGVHDVLILYCRTGGRSSLAGTGVSERGLFGRVYEIDDPAGNNGRGGFSGADYNNAYNGYLGFPGRTASDRTFATIGSFSGCGSLGYAYMAYPWCVPGNQGQSSAASWSDAGLPVTIGFKPLPVH